jgi:hypothetical protein
MRSIRIAMATPAILSLVMLTSPAQASTAFTAAGSFTSVVTITSVRVADGNTFVTGTEVQMLTGWLIGTRVAEGVEVIHADGTFEASDTGTFTGTVAGQDGSIVISGNSMGAGLTGFGRLVVDRGTLGLAGLHGDGTFVPTITGPTTAAGTYSIRLSSIP